MPEFPLIVSHHDIDTPSSIQASFSHPIIFFYGHQADQRNVFITFAILDIPAGKIARYASYSDASAAQLEARDPKKWYQSKAAFNPHAVISCGHQRYLVFIEHAHFFYELDLSRLSMKTRTWNDLPHGTSEQLSLFGSTFYPDDKDPNFFYLTGLAGTQGGTKSVVIFRASVDLLSFEKIYTLDHQSYCPHVTRTLGSFIFNSDFDDVPCYFPQSGLTFSHPQQAIKHIYRSIYQDFCTAMQMPCTEENCEKAICLHGDKFEEYCTLSPDFELFMHATFGTTNAMHIALQHRAYSFETLPGSITLVDAPRQAHATYRTTVSTPAHFEFDPAATHVYTSSHNFVSLEKSYFLGPAAIDKFRITSTGLEKEATFSHPSGYRFTTHRVFSYQGTTYICTLGQPNRMFLIEAATMSLARMLDIGEDELSRQANIRDYLNARHREDGVIKAIEVSDDGSYLVFVGQEKLFFYGMKEGAIVHSAPHTDARRDTGVYLRTTHCQYIT